MRPSFKRPGEDIDIRVKTEMDKMRVEFDNKVKAEVEERVKTILKEKEDTEKKEKAERIATAVSTARAIKGGGAGSGVDAERDDKIPSLSPIKSEKNDIICPTCHKDHIHKLETDKTGLVYKCHGDKCGYEYVFVPKNSDYKCSTCGMAIKKPESPDLAKDMSCPFCHGSKGVKFDWSKIWSIKK